jgi:uncharacterized protein (UPF0332 family)
VKEEAALHMQKARKLLDLAQRLIRHGYDHDGARDSYLAGYHAAQALIVDRTGKAAKTYEGAHSQFAHLTLNEPLIDVAMKRFLPDAYVMKTAAENGLGDTGEIPHERATEAVAKAALFIERIAHLLTPAFAEAKPRLRAGRHPPNPARERSDASLR